MSVFTEAEIGYLESNTMGRLATIGADGRPHLVPLTYRFNAAEDAICDVSGHRLAGVLGHRCSCGVFRHPGW